MLATLLIALALALPVTGSSSPAEGRVVNGIEVTPHSYPWQLSLQYKSGFSYYHTCGAVVLNENFAITAAHCVDGRTATNFRVSCGAHNIRGSESGRQEVDVTAYVKHPYYNPSGNGFPNDAAVLKLSRPLTFDYKCQPAKLDDGSIEFSNTPTKITGWGRLQGGGSSPSKLKEGDVEALSDSGCRWFYSRYNPTAHLCVKDLGDKIHGGCNGDSGGPAQVGDTVVGLASFVFGSCLTSYPTVYARISSYLPWIYSTASSM